jgi:16S rRNA (cytosine967-C5)-methyltransferase
MQPALERRAPPLAHLLASAAQVLAEVRAGRSLSELLPGVSEPLRAGTQALSFTVLRRLGAAERVRRALVPRRPEAAVEALLLTALALLWPDPAPAYAEHTVVDQAVAAARRCAPAAAGFVNAVLRRFLREREAQVAAARRDPGARFNHPRWWIERLQADWPEHWQALLERADEHPPMTLRVNRRHMSGAQYVHQLGAAGIGARVLGDPGLLGQAVVLDVPCPVAALPGFAEGTVSVQDSSAQRAAPLLLGAGLPEGARVLDACAAPGGKSAHLLELASLELLALDVDRQRLARVEENLARLSLRAQTRCADARQPATWWDGRPFDAILLDAPCSASGIVRRHPDVRWLRREADIAALARTQAELLAALWPLLRAGGTLLYATCSLFKAEGEQQIDAFLQRLGPGAVCLRPESPGHLLGLADNRGAGDPDSATSQHDRSGDGFFYAALGKP